MTEWRCGCLRHVRRSFERRDERRRQDDGVAGFAREDALTDGADGAVSALDAKACLGAKVVGDGCDEPLCSTGGKEPQATFTLGLHWSGFAPEIFTMRSHLTMSSFR